MVQAARSGKQNIIEGSVASATSKEMEIKLTNVVRASLEELLADYHDFLRLRGLEELCPKTREMRNPRIPCPSFQRSPLRHSRVL
jgi:hypothetical protein